MDLHILSLGEAVKHQPDKPTYAIRIFNSNKNYNNFPLKTSSMYRGVNSYVFDDIDPFFHPDDGVMIDAGIADEIVRDFDKCRHGVEALLVHCLMGENRSPAVAIALNEVFGLGHDTRILMESYSAYTMYAYDKLCEAGKRLRG